MTHRIQPMQTPRHKPLSRLAVKTLYIAGPMTGITDFNYPAFNAAEAQLRQAGYSTLNPATIDDGGVQQPWEWYMRHALTMVLQVEAIATLPGWEASRGARIEVATARILGMNVESARAWLDIAEDKTKARDGR